MNKHNIIKNILLSLFVIFCGLILVVSIRGKLGNPTVDDLQKSEWTSSGPLELSPDRGRFALLYSYIEEKSFTFSTPIARFASPDVGYKDGKYVSLFAPALSFIVIPGYLIGKFFNASQVGTSAVVAVFALLNLILIYKISRKLGVTTAAACLAGLAYLFGTPAFTYAVTLYQHHISTFMILISLYALIAWGNFLGLCLIWFMCALSISVDYPNLFLMAPIGIAALGKIIYAQTDLKNITLNVKLPYILTFFIMVLPMAFFFWFNKESYGNPLQLAGTVKQAKAIDENGVPYDPSKIDLTNAANLLQPGQAEPVEIVTPEQPAKKKEAVKFFKTRNLLNGFYIHTVSPDRGVLVYAPIILFGILGALVLGKKDSKTNALLVSLVVVNILIYSMWGDPWGGWAFGSRYLIPAYAIMCIYLGILLDSWKKYSFLLLFVSLVLGFSIWINVAGAITSSLNPPQVEVLKLESLSGKQEKYNYERNLDYLRDNKSKSVVFNEIGKKYFSAWEYYYIISGSISAVGAILLIAHRLNGRSNNE